MSSIDILNTHMPRERTHGVWGDEQHNDPDALYNKELLDTYSSTQMEWGTEAQSNTDYYDNLQYTAEQIELLGQRGQAAIPVNVITPATEMAIALLTARNPSWQATGRDDSDRKLADVMSDMGTYVWQKNGAREIVKSILYDAYITGRGVMRIGVDPYADMGKGEIVYEALDPKMVFPDPNSRDKYWRDASNIVVLSMSTREQIENLWPEAAMLLEEEGMTGETYWRNRYRPARQRSNPIGSFTPAGVIDNHHEHYEIIERYTKVRMPYFRVLEVTEDKEMLMQEQEFMQYLQEPAFIMQQNGESTYIVENAEVQQAMLLYQQGIPLEENIMLIEGQVVEGPDGRPVKMPAYTLTLVNNEVMIQMGVIEAVQVMINRIKYVCTINDRIFQKLYLPLEEYPLVPLHFRHFRDPYPKSDISYVRPLQDSLNNLWSKMIAGISNVTNLKILFPKGSIRKETLEADLGKSGTAAIEFDHEEGNPPPQLVQPMAVPNTIQELMSYVVNMIERTLGVYSVMQGDPAGLASSHKSIVAIDEMGNRRISAKQKDLEAFLNQIGKIVSDLIPMVYSSRRTIRIVQSNNQIRETVVNDWVQDERTGEIEKMNDLGVGKYDLIIVSGSMLPTNRQQEVELWKELYLTTAQAGLPVAEQMLYMMMQKMDIPDLDAIMEKAGLLNQAQQQIQQSQAAIENLQGDLQTRERELYHARVQTELAKAKANIQGEVEKMKKAAQLYENRAQDMEQMDKTILDYERKLKIAANKTAAQ